MVDRLDRCYDGSYCYWLVHVASHFRTIQLSSSPSVATLEYGQSQWNHEQFNMAYYHAHLRSYSSFTFSPFTCLLQLNGMLLHLTIDFCLKRLCSPFKEGFAVMIGQCDIQAFPHCHSVITFEMLSACGRCGTAMDANPLRLSRNRAEHGTSIR